MTFEELKAIANAKAEKAKPRHEESQIQRSCLRWFRLQYPQYALLCFAVPNGGARNKREASREVLLFVCRYAAYKAFNLFLECLNTHAYKILCKDKGLNVLA